MRDPVGEVPRRVHLVHQYALHLAGAHPLGTTADRVRPEGRLVGRRRRRARPNHQHHLASRRLRRHQRREGGDRPAVEGLELLGQFPRDNRRPLARARRRELRERLRHTVGRFVDHADVRQRRERFKCLLPVASLPREKPEEGEAVGGEPHTDEGGEER